MYKGFLLVFFTALVSGLSIFMNSFAVKGFDSSVFTFSKNVAVAGVLLAVIVAFGKIRELARLSLREWLSLCLIGLVGGSIPFLLFFAGVKLVSAQDSAFIHKSMFLYITVFAVLFLKERISWLSLAAAALLIAGNYLVLLPDISLSKGHLFVFMAALLWAAENTYAKHVLKSLSGTVVAFGRMFFGSIFILAYLMITGKSALVFSMSPAQYAWILLTASLLFLYVITYYNGLRLTKVTTASYILTIGSPITYLLTLIAGSAVSLHELAGMLLIVSGFAAAVYSAGLMPVFVSKSFVVRLFGRN